MKTKSSAIFIAVAFGFMAPLPKAHAVVPAPDGCYPNYTTAEGCNALSLLGSGAGNTAIGWYSLFSDSTGSFNTGVGGGALALNNADSNTAVGAGAMLLNTTGSENTAVGTDALVHNDTGSNNNAFGNNALLENIRADNNTAIGNLALANNDVTGNGVANDNTAIGAGALFLNTDGNANTAVGYQALRDNTIGLANTATGYQALMVFTGTTGNTANGYQALLNHMTGNDNVAIGALALVNNTIGGGNIALGTSAGANIAGDENIDIGNTGDAADSHTIRIGNNQTRAFIAGIRGVTTGNNNAIPVLIDGQGQLGTMSSSRRFKHEVKPMGNASKAIHALKPVTFHYKSDDTGTPRFGLIAEEVAEINPDLVVRDKNGEIYTVRYEAVNAMLLNEFLKEHRKVDEQQAAIAGLKSVVAEQQKQFQAAIAEQRKQFDARLSQQDAKIQTVRDRIELSNPARQAVANNE